MGVLVGYGFAVLFGVGIGLIFSIIGLFFGNIMLFDSLALAVLAGFLSNGLLHIHPALAVLIGIAVLIVLYFLHTTRAGFWILGTIMSLLWGLLIAVIVYDAAGDSQLWGYISWALATLAFLGLHLHARSRIE